MISKYRLGAKKNKKQICCTAIWSVIWWSCKQAWIVLFIYWANTKNKLIGKITERKRESVPTSWLWRPLSSHFELEQHSSLHQIKFGMTCSKGVGEVLLFPPVNEEYRCTRFFNFSRIIFENGGRCHNMSIINKKPEPKEAIQLDFGAWMGEGAPWLLSYVCSRNV